MSRVAAKVPARCRSVQRTQQQHPHGGRLVWIDCQGTPGSVFGFPPLAQKDIGLREASLDIWITRVLVDRSFQLVQGAIPFALPAMHKGDELKRQRVVRPKLERALKLS